MSKTEARPGSKKNPGTSGDVIALAAGKVEQATLFASLAHAVGARRGARIVLAGAFPDSPPDALRLGCRRGEGMIGWKALAALARSETLLAVVAGPSPRRFMNALLALAETHASVEACFMDYVVWLPGGSKNAAVDRLNARINSSQTLALTGYILDPEGRPGIIVGRRIEPERRV